MKKFAAVIAAGVIALGLAGCETDWKYTVSEAGKANFEVFFTMHDSEISEYQKNLAAGYSFFPGMKPPTVDCAYLAQRLNEKNFLPSKATADEVPADGGGKACKIIVPGVSDGSAQSVNKSAGVEVNGDSWVFRLPADTAKSMIRANDEAVKVMSPLGEKPAAMLVVQMPADITSAKSGERDLPFEGDTVRVPMSDIADGVEVHAGETVGLLGFVLLAGFLVVAGLIVAVVVLVFRNRRLKNQNQGGGQPGGVAFPGVSG